VSEPETERVVIVLRERPPAAVAMRLHRLLGIGAAEVLKRADDAQPLLDRGLWLNDRIPLAHLLRDVVDAVAGLAFDVHVVAPEGAAGPDTVTGVQVLWNMLLADREAPPAVRPEPDLELARAIADATRAALSELPGSVADDLCAVALVTTGDGLRPYLTVTVDVDERWDLAASEFALIGDEHFEALRDVWDARGDLYELDDEALDVEFAVRLATLEEALRLLDIEGVFGAGEARQQVLLLVATMPPDPSDAAYARRLNPDGPRFRDWLREASEAPELVPAPPYSEATPTVDVTPPGPVLAELWSISRGVLLADGTQIYAPEDIEERNETFQVAEYAPGWVLVGDDGGGLGYLMRRAAGGFDPVEARAVAEVYRLDVGALSDRITDDGEYITDDLIGWLATRNGDC